MLDIEEIEEQYDLKEIYCDRLEKLLKRYPILEFETIDYWIKEKISLFSSEGKNPKEFSITAYLGVLNCYCKFNNVSDPNELLKEPIKAINLRVKNYLQFLMNAKEKDLDRVKEIGFRKIPNDVSIRNNIQSRIKSFYSTNGIKVSYKLKTRKKGDNSNELLLTKDIIKKIQSKLESSNYRLICKFASQTGLRIGDILKEFTSGKYKIEKIKNRYCINNFKTHKRQITINFMFLSKELEDFIKGTTTEENYILKKSKKREFYDMDDLTTLDLTTLFLTRERPQIERIEKDKNGKKKRFLL